MKTDVVENVVFDEPRQRTYVVVADRTLTDGELQRGISTQDAVNMIVNGFCKNVLQKLPMEFAVEAQKLPGASREGSVG